MARMTYCPHVSETTKTLLFPAIDSPPLCRHCSATPLSLPILHSRTPDYTQGSRLVVWIILLIYVFLRIWLAPHQSWLGPWYLITVFIGATGHMSTRTLTYLTQTYFRVLALIPSYVAVVYPHGFMYCYGYCVYPIQNRALKQQGGSTYRPAYPLFGDFGYSTNHVYLHRFSRLRFCVCV